MNKNKIIIATFIFLIIIFDKIVISNKLFFFQLFFKSKRVGVINLPDSRNIGNMMVKFAMFTKLKELGLNATIICPKHKIDKLKIDSSFLFKTVNSHLLYVNDNFSELKENDFDYLMVNSDQTWNFYNYKFFYNVALLKFAENWNVNKFIYAASMAKYNWYYNKSDDELFKKLLAKFTGISFRERGTVKILYDNLKIKSFFVLDPTLLIDKHYYLDEIYNYNPNFLTKEKFIFVYQLDKNTIIEKTIIEASKKFNFKINRLRLLSSNYVENFIYGISHCEAVITDSFHGTIFSIIFQKPFISFSNEIRGKARFDSLRETFNLDERILVPSKNSNININLLLYFPSINKKLFNKLKHFSLRFLKTNLGLF